MAGYRRRGCNPLDESAVRQVMAPAPFAHIDPPATVPRQSPRGRIRQRLSEARDDERGQSLIIVVLAMFVLLGMGALGIDMATWYQRHHSAQVAADAAALAAANYMANGGNAGSATTTATTYAASNQSTIAASNVTVDATAHTVTVQVPVSAPPILASLLGIKQYTSQVQAKAGWGYKTCSSLGTSGSNCFSIFAYNSTPHSGSSTGAGAAGATNNGNKGLINGTVHSNGSIYNNGNNSMTFQGPYNTYGTTTGDLNANGTLGSNNLPYPMDYTASSYASNYAPFPNGGNLSEETGTTAPTLTGCTYTASSFVLSGSWPAGVYCASGTITIESGTVTASEGMTGATYEASQIVVNANTATLTPYDYPNNSLLFYADYGGWNASNGTGCSSGSSNSTVGLDFAGASGDITEGDAFAPCSSIYFTSNNAAWSPAFLEAYNVNLAGNSFRGDGPQTNSTGVAYVDQLSQ